jgi:hypothetical protein
LAALNPQSDPRTKAFAVRAVSPNAGGVCNVELRGEQLYVFCGGLGEYQYKMWPLNYLSQSETRPHMDKRVKRTLIRPQSRGSHLQEDYSAAQA